MPVTERKPVKSELSFANGARAVDLPAENVVLTGRDALVELDRKPVVFAGYGTAHDLAGVDVRGAVVLALSANPPGKSDVATWSERRAALAKAGAAAVIGVEPANKGWDIGARLKEETLVADRRAVRAGPRHDVARRGARGARQEREKIARRSPGAPVHRPPSGRLGDNAGRDRGRAS